MYMGPMRGLFEDPLRAFARAVLSAVGAKV
jgi:hypothetical protein